LEGRDSLTDRSALIRQTQEQYHQHRIETVQLLTELTTYHANKQSEWKALCRLEPTTLQQEMRHSFRKEKMEKELAHMTDLKGQLLETLHELDIRIDTLALEVDRVLFDNIVMLDMIFRNFEQLKSLSTQP
jgi:hypothetical protein